VQDVFDGAMLYPGNAYGDAPDLVIGYAPGFRASWQTTLGAVPISTIDDNDKKWSGDHCITPKAVPGVLFTSFRTDATPESLRDVAQFAMEHWKRGQ